MNGTHPIGHETGSLHLGEEKSLERRRSLLLLLMTLEKENLGVCADTVRLIKAKITK